jgi:hypothetical protein
MNLTEPVGVPDVLELTLAVNVIDWPSPDGFEEETSAAVLLACWTVSASVTVCFWKLLSPE